jgi:hypothetical protein
VQASVGIVSDFAAAQCGHVITDSAIMNLPTHTWRLDITFMPKGPQGRKRPAGVIGNAVHVAH